MDEAGFNTKKHNFRKEKEFSVYTIFLCFQKLFSETIFNNMNPTNLKQLSPKAYQKDYLMRFLPNRMSSNISLIYDFPLLSLERDT